MPVTCESSENRGNPGRRGSVQRLKAASLCLQQVRKRDSLVFAMDLRGFIFAGLWQFWHGRADAPLNSTSSHQGHCDANTNHEHLKMQKNQC